MAQNEPHLSHATALVHAALAAAAMTVQFDDAPSSNERRNLFMISTGQTHLDMMPATPHRLRLVEQGKLRVIPIPLDRGLLGYRINLLLQSQREKLARVRTVSDLARFTLGQNEGWMDIEIYRAAGIPTKEIKRWSNGEFAEQMEAGFLDLFPLGLEETLNYFLPHFQRRYPQLTIDPYVLVHYPWFRFVWVSPQADATPLFEALQYGFDAIASNGSFLSLWSQRRRPPAPRFFENRTLIEINNPFYGNSLVPARYQHLLYRKEQR